MRRNRTYASLLAALALPAKLTVCSTCEIKTISRAFEAAQPGSTVIVEAGVYRETGLRLNKALHLVGKNNPILDMEEKSHGIDVVKADGFSIEGFTIRNSGLSYVEERSAVKVFHTNGCRIENNRFENNTFGVYLGKSSGCVVTKNVFVGTNKDESDSGNGVHIWSGSDHWVDRNTVSNHRDGIYFEFVKNTKVTNNHVSSNFRYGLHFMFSDNDVYEDNHFSKNGAGVAVMYSRNIKMLRNRFVANTGPSSYGMLLKEIFEAEIKENSFMHNTTGIFMEGSNRNHFQANDFSANGIGLKVMSDCESNDFSNNNFIRNTFDVTTNGTNNFNTFRQNYWGRYDGYDLNHDGKGDVPYRPVSIAAIIFEKIDSTYFLFNSFLFLLLEKIERALPEVIPQSLQDDEPMMEIFSR